MRKEQEDIVMEAHRAGRIQATILRLPDFYGPGVERSFLHDIFVAIANGRAAKMVGPIDIPHEYVFVPDVGPVVVRLALEPRAYGQTWNLGGAGTVVPRAFANQAFALAGKKPRIVVANKLLLRFLGLFDPMMRELVEMHYLLTTPLIVDDHALRSLLGEPAKTSYEDGIKQCLAAVERAPAVNSPSS
jgi:nucleoside-diphosphate-sugar epimerase